MVRILTLQLALVAVLAIPSAVSAGGWAVIVLDEVPGTFTSGVSHHVGFTVLQHGTKPADGLRPAIGLTASGSRQSLEFSARPHGAPGHYVAEVRFPASGEWAWEVRPGVFPTQQLGSVRVEPSAGIDSQSTQHESSGTATPRPGLALVGRELIPVAVAVVVTLAILSVLRFTHPFSRQANG